MKKIYLFCFLLTSRVANAEYYFDAAMSDYQEMKYTSSFYNLLESASIGNVEAAFYLGIYNLHGIGTINNREMAFVWLTISSKSCNPHAGRILREIFRDEYANNDFTSEQIENWGDIFEPASKCAHKNK